jgi:hypothetical protein
VVLDNWPADTADELIFNPERQVIVFRLLIVCAALALCFAAVPSASACPLGKVIRTPEKAVRFVGSHRPKLFARNR